MCLPFPSSRLTTEYEVRGIPSRLSSCMTATPNGSGPGDGVINQVALAYNNFGQLVADAQEHNGSIDDATPGVQYGYADGFANSINPNAMTYPDVEYKVEYKGDWDRFCD